MKKYVITINNKKYEVEVEEQSGVSVQLGTPKITAAPVPAPTAVAAPVAAPTPAPAPAPAPAKAAAPAGAGAVTAPMPGTVINIAVKEGDTVTAGQFLLAFEAMKMENEMFAPCDGVVKTIHVAVGTAIDSGSALITIE